LHLRTRAADARSPLTAVSAAQSPNERAPRGVVERK